MPFVAWASCPCLLIVLSGVLTWQPFHRTMMKHLHKVTPFLFAIVLLTSVASDPGHAEINPRFHTYPEMLAEIDSLLGLYSDIMLVDTIGYSTQDTIPIIAVKLSDTVQAEEDEPAVLYVGQVHAEEILGNEIVMELLYFILNNRGTNRVIAWLTTCQIWIVPTANPEGLSVVMAELDETFRKNKRDNIGDGIFRYVPGRGGDTSGVDINRNFDLNWDRGDTLFYPGAYELYDYYRGPAPFSEGESHALRDLSDRIKPVFSIIYHSSRTGNVAEHVIYPWGWADVKFPPPADSAVITYEAQRLASMIPKYGGIGHYIPSYHSPRDGTAGDWFYQALGTVQFWIEVGTSNIQPDTISIINQIVADNMDAAKFLLDRFIDYGGEPNRSTFYGHVTDSVTGLPLHAEVRVLEAYSRLQAPRMTNEFGTYYRPLLAGSYDLMFLAEGYRTKVIENVTCNPTSPTLRNVSLAPLPMYTISGTIEDLATSNILPGTVYIIGEFSDTLDVPSGSFSVQKPQGEYTILVAADDNPVPYSGTLSLSSNRSFAFGLPGNADILLSEGFESGLGNWSTGGSQNSWGTIAPGLLSGFAASESPDSEYANSMDSWLQTETPLDISSYHSAALTFWHSYDFEVDYDSAFVEVSSDGGSNWDVVSPGYCRWNQDWLQEWISLNDYVGLSSVLLRFHARSDGSLGEQGWVIDNVRVVASADSATTVTDQKVPVPLTFKLFPPYPNPFNASVMIPYRIAQPGEISIMIINVLGQRVFHLRRSHAEAGQYKFLWQGTGDNGLPLASGIYFVTFKAGSFRQTQKALLLK